MWSSPCAGHVVNSVCCWSCGQLRVLVMWSTPCAGHVVTSVCWSCGRLDSLVVWSTSYAGRVVNYVYWSCGHFHVLVKWASSCAGHVVQSASWLLRALGKWLSGQLVNCCNVANSARRTDQEVNSILWSRWTF